LIAEEVAKPDPEPVARDKEGKPYTLRYDPVKAMLLNQVVKEPRTLEQLERRNAGSPAFRYSRRTWTRSSQKPPKSIAP
jgi:hypothetical protein